MPDDGRRTAARSEHPFEIGLVELGRLPEVVDDLDARRAGSRRRASARPPRRRSARRTARRAARGTPSGRLTGRWSPRGLLGVRGRRQYARRAGISRAAAPRQPAGHRRAASSRARIRGSRSRVRALRAGRGRPSGQSLNSSVSQRPNGPGGARSGSSATIAASARLAARGERVDALAVRPALGAGIGSPIADLDAPPEPEPATCR